MEGPGETIPPENVYSMPGFISSMFQIQVQVPANLPAEDVGNGVKRATVGLELGISYESPKSSVSNMVGVYVK